MKDPKYPKILYKGYRIPNLKDNTYYDVIRNGITLKYKIFDLKTRTYTEKTLKNFHFVETRDMRNSSPCYIYSLVYGIPKMVTRKGEKYVPDYDFITVGCKGLNFQPEKIITEISIENYGRYRIWEPGRTPVGYKFNYIKDCLFHPEEVLRFDRDAATLFRVVKRNPVK